MSASVILKKRKWIGSSIGKIMVCLTLASCSSERVVRSEKSPDGRYRVEVVATGRSTGKPGQAMDRPGVVRLIDNKGRVLHEKKTDYIGAIDVVRWTDESVYIKLFARWRLD